MSLLLHYITNGITQRLNYTMEKLIFKNYMNAIKSTHIFRRGKSYLIDPGRWRINCCKCKKMWNSKCRSLSTTATKYEKNLTVKNINPNILNIKFEIRGPIPRRAAVIEKELQSGMKKPFESVIRVNLGDAQAMLQKPITFSRQLLCATFYPEFMEKGIFPEDIVERARCILKYCGGGSIGSYTESIGIEIIRRQIADYIEERDGYPSDYRNIFLTDGVSAGIRSLISLISGKINGKLSGLMVPIPQFPMYGVFIAMYGMCQVDYYLDEENGWSLQTTELQRAYDESLDKCHPRAIVVVNPGNPTGQVLTRENIKEIIKFAHKNKLIIFADEVYQLNIWDEKSEFFSLKKVMNEMGEPYSQMELISSMSSSKGVLAECGLRGGCLEIFNFDPDLMATIMKSIFALVCSNSAGQVALSAMVNPPREGEPSYELYKEESNAILCSLKERAELTYNSLKNIEGFKVNKTMGALYTFPRILLPPRAIEAAKAKNVEPDFLYGMELLENTGICIVPGHGFGQKPGTYHFRGTILPPISILKEMMDRLYKFHVEFMEKYK